MTATPLLTAVCSCGKVELHAAGPPILAVACYCADCRRAGEGFALLPSAPPLMDAHGGTPCVLFRKDRVRCIRGRELLREHRLTPDSSTRRVVASCCQAPMFGDFTKGHWLSLYRARCGDDAPPPQMRIMTRGRRAGVVLDDAVPNYPGFPPRFLFKLLAVWAGMRFARPAMAF